MTARRIISGNGVEAVAEYSLGLFVEEQQKLRCSEINGGWFDGVRSLDCDIAFAVGGLLSGADSRQQAWPWRVRLDGGLPRGYGKPVEGRLLCDWAAR